MSGWRERLGWWCAEADARRRFAPFFVALVLTAFWTGRWWSRLADSLPDPSSWGGPAEAADARLAVWTMAWQAHALISPAASFYDANILHPARGMLTGSDTFFTPALLAAPLNGLFGNALLAANIVLVIGYGLAVLLGIWVARAVGRGFAGSVIFGGAVALGPLAVPASAHVLQYPSWVLLLVLLAVARAGRAGTVRAWAAAACAVALGLLTSMYMAAMTLVVVAVEALVVAPGGRAKRALGLAGAVVPGGLLLAGAALPWLRRSGDLQGSPAVLREGLGVIADTLLPSYLDPTNSQFGVGWIVASLGLLGLIEPLLRRERPSRDWWRWTLLLGAGVILALGPRVVVGGVRIPLPYSLIVETPAVALRGFYRFFIVGHLGLAGLAARGCDSLLSIGRAWFGARASALLAAGLIVAALLPRSELLRSTELRTLPTDPELDAIHRRLAASADPGAVLEIPGPGDALTLGRMALQADYMLYSTRHWRPLINGFTGYPPWWWSWLRREIAGLPGDATAWGAVVDATAVRWIVVHRTHLSAHEWQSWQEAAARLPGVERVAGGKQHLLLRVDRMPQRSWLERLREGRFGPEETILGTRRAPLEPADTRGRLTLRGPVPPVEPGRAFVLRLTLRNAGGVAWPALAPRDDPGEGLVVIESRWHAAVGGAQVPPATARLLRDVFPGEVQTESITLVGPPGPGTYDLELSLHQVGVGPLRSVPPLSLRVENRAVDRKPS